MTLYSFILEGKSCHNQKFFFLAIIFIAFNSPSSTGKKKRKPANRVRTFNFYMLINT